MAAEVTCFVDVTKNYVIHSENLAALTTLEKDLKEKVSCVYIDPPYNTFTLKTHFNDSMRQDDWLKMMRDRITLLHGTLKENGTMWISINDSECHSLKLLCDQIFSRQNFLMTIIWEKSDVKDNLTPFVKESHDYVLCYAKNRLACEAEIRQKFPWGTIWKREEVGDTFDALKEVTAFNQKDVFPTPKPEGLIYRILSIASNKGDLVLDCFGGSGTTAAVAHKMDRRWVVIEQGDQCVNHIVPRINAVIQGTDQGGVSKQIGWQGGGKYQFFEFSEPKIKQVV